MAYIEDDQVEEGHKHMDDKGSNALQLAHYGLGVLQCKGQMLPFLQSQLMNCHPQVGNTVTFIQCCSSLR